MVQVFKEDFPEFLYYHALSSGIMATDIETSGLYIDQGAKLGCVTVYIPDSGVYCARDIDDNPRVLKSLLGSKHIKKIFHHAPFDLKFLMYYVTKEIANVACTKVAAKLHDPHRTKFYNPATQKASHSYAALVYELTGEQLEKETALSDWFVDEYSETQLKYIENDVIYLPAILKRLSIKLQREGKYREMEAAFDFLPTRIRLELDGIKDVYGYE